MDAFGTLLAAFVVGVWLLAAFFALLWLVRALSSPRARLRPRPIAGTLARVVVAIPRSGVGRIAYTAHGKRCSMAARSDDQPVPPGAEVLLVTVERGVAWVVSFDELERNPS